MADFYSDKLFEFTNVFADNSEWVGNIKVVQIGETCLDKGASINEHIQRCNEITFITSGTGTLIADQDEYKCSVGDLQIISKGIKHDIIADKNSELRYIHFAFNFFDYKPEIISEFYEQCKHIILHDNGNIRSILDMLVDEYINDLGFRDIMKTGLVNTALILVWRKATQQSIKNKAEINTNLIGNTVYSIIKYINRNMDKKITVNDVAKEFSYSNEYVSRLFKKKTGISMKKYILTAKMEYAQTLLSERKCSLAEITNITGYSSIQAFCKAFKNHTGYTPKQFDEYIK